ncbi:MAG: CDP-glycerol glycerophosphotransferase family protein [Chlamydiales bacterium]
MVSKSVGVIPGPRTSFLDHLAPICYLMNIPLHCSDEWVATCAAQFYPEIKIIEGDLSTYQTFYVVEPCRLHSRAVQFGDAVYHGHFKTIAGFHGNPDKFRQIFWIERYLDEDVILIYGEHLVDYLKQKGIFKRLKKIIRIGNLRYAFYKHHQNFFDRLLHPHFSPDPQKKTILWAPTWSYPDPCQAFSAYRSILNQIPEEYQVYVKLHPYTYRLFPDQIVQMKEEYTKFHFIDEIPLIYPFLNQVDIYLGDESSVAYDFLAFNRPIFFLGKKEVSWGITVRNPKRLFQELDRPDHLAEARQKIYHYVFGEEVSLTQLQKQL